jgi:hypothetical protein
VNILVKDGNDELLKISNKQAAWLMNTFQCAADASRQQIKGITTLVANTCFVTRERKFIPLALDFAAIEDRLGDASRSQKDADLTDVSGSAVNALCWLLCSPSP